MNPDNLRPATLGETGAYLSGRRTIEGAVETEHGLMVPAHQNVVIYETRYREDDVHDGDVPRDDVTTTVYDCDDVEAAVHIFVVEGLSFAATGNAWAANPDGSRIVDYAEGIRVETTAHLYGWSDDETAAIMAAVG